MHPQDRLFCEIAVQLQLLTRQQAAHCMQAQEREAVGQSIATVALALGFMDQAAVDTVVHQQQRVLARRREARELSRMQREAESRAAAGIGPGEGIDTMGAATERPPAPRGPGRSGAAPRGDAFESVPEAAARSAEAGPRYSGTFGDARHSSSTPRYSGFSDARSSAAPSGGPESEAVIEGFDALDDADNADADLSSLAARAERVTAPPSRGFGASAPRIYDTRQRMTGESSHADAGDATASSDLEAAAIGDTHDLRDTLEDRPPLPRSLLGSLEQELAERQTIPLDRPAPSAPPAALGTASSKPPVPGASSSLLDRAASSAPPAAPGSASSKPPVLQGGSAPPAALGTASSKPPVPRASSSLPPSAAEGALAQSARGTLLESSGMEQQRRDLTAPQRQATGRPIPSIRDWRNPSRPPPAAEGFEVEMPLRPHHSLLPKARSSRPPLDAPRSSRPPRSINAPSLDAPRHLARALELCAQHGASDYHLHSGALPRMRIDGALFPLRADQLASEAVVESILAEVLGDEERMQLTLDGELRMLYQSETGIRARLSAWVSEQGSQAQLHLLPTDVPSAEQLGLAAPLRILREKPWGLAICSGPAGSGITTTLWALAQGLAGERARYSVSLESPLELNVQCGVGLFEQREVGRHVESYAAGVAWALAEGADLIVVSDLLAPGAFEACLHAARARCLVLAGVRAGSSFAALRRLLTEAQGDPELLRRSLADGLRLLLHQRLLPRRGTPGTVAAFELVLGSGRLMQHLRRAEMLQLAAALEVSREPELFTLRDALNDLVRSSVISTEAMRSALGVDRGCLEG